MLYLALIALIICQRLLELKYSANNERLMRKKGGREIFPRNFTYMQWIHTSWFIAILIEYFLRKEAVSFNGLFFVVFIIGQALRFAAISTLRERWSVRLMILPHQKIVHHGIYKYIRHPNYLGVILEIAALPMVMNLYFTAIVFSLLNFWVLKLRIQCEERALNREKRYYRFFKKRKRFLPYLF